MPDPKDTDPNKIADRLSEVGSDDGPSEEEDFSDVVDVPYRGRGRPKLPPEQKRREKLVIALTGEELKKFMIEAASVEGGPMRVQDWARRELLKATEKEKKE